MDKKTASTQIEEERLFGADVDLFKSYHAVKFLHNILKAIGLREIKDNDFYRSAATYVTSEEISEIYDSILPKKKTRGNCGIALPDAAGNRGRRP